MRSVVYKSLLMVVSLLTLASVLLSAPMVKKFCCSSEYKTFTSSDKKHYIKLHRYKVFPDIVPGSTGDAPGYVRLYNNEHHLMQEKEIEMIQMVDQVEWQTGHVIIKFIVEWDLTKLEAVPELSPQIKY